MKRFNFNKPLVESPYPPSNINVLWIKQEPDGEVVIYEYKREDKGGRWLSIKLKELPVVKEKTILFTSTTCPNITNTDIISVIYLNLFGMIEFKDIISLNDIFDGSDVSQVFLPENTNITTIPDRAFSNCYLLSQFTIPKTVTSIGYSAFYNTNLTHIDLPNGVTEISESAFLHCPLKEINLPENLISIGSSAFEGKGYISSLYIPKSVLSIADSSFTFKTFNTITVDPENTYYDSRDNCNAIVETATNELFIGSNATDTNNIPESITTINSCAFYGCTKQKSIKVHKNISFFGGGEALTNSAITSVCWDTNLVGSHGYYTTFGSHSSKITHLEFGPNVTKIIGRMCEDMINLKSVTLPDSITEILNDAFKNSGILELTIPKNVTWIDQTAFRGLLLYKDKFINNSTLDAEANDYWGLTLVSEIINGYGIRDGLLVAYPLNELNIVIPDKVLAIQSNMFTLDIRTITIPKSVTWIGENAFLNSWNLNKVNYTGDVASWCGITFTNEDANPISRSGNLYINNQQVRDLVIPDSVENIPNHAFVYCSTLNSVTIPDSVKTIGDNVFGGCWNINTITIGSGLQSIGLSAFYISSSATIYYSGTEEQWKAISGTSNILCNVIYNA